MSSSSRMRGRSDGSSRVRRSNVHARAASDLLRATAEVLGKKEDADFYARLLDQIRAAFQKEFVTPNGRLSSNTQTAYALALAFDLLPQSQRKEAAERLAEDVRAFKHITTGFLGTPYLLEELTKAGYAKLAYQLLLNTGYPSWGYLVEHGATTMWERWNGDQMRDDAAGHRPR